MIILLSGACTSVPDRPLHTADHVDLERFMGDWYVIANIPTFIERDAYNAIETYDLADDGTIATTFSFRQGGFDGERKQYNFTGIIRNRESNAVWGMQFIWPFRADYRIMYVDEEYSVTVIGRNKRDYVWIMARTPAIETKLYQQLVEMISEQGYDIGKIRQIPQQPRH
ncbi:MAG: lipocalin family protein, partial [Gammaproteobacteria bacterium]